MTHCTGGKRVESECVEREKERNQEEGSVCLSRSHRQAARHLFLYSCGCSPILFLLLYLWLEVWRKRERKREKERTKDRDNYHYIVCVDCERFLRDGDEKREEKRRANQREGGGAKGKETKGRVEGAIGDETVGPSRSRSVSHISCPNSILWSKGNNLLCSCPRFVLVSMYCSPRR